MQKYSKIKTIKQLENAWELYKHNCDSQTACSYVFSPKASQFVSKELKHRLPYSLNGFCVYLKISRSNFKNAFENNPLFSDTVTRFREECEVDELRKLQTGEIPLKFLDLFNNPKSQYHSDPIINTKTPQLNFNALSDDELVKLNEIAGKLASADPSTNTK